MADVTEPNNIYNIFKTENRIQNKIKKEHNTCETYNSFKKNLLNFCIYENQNARCLTVTRRRDAVAAKSQLCYSVIDF